MDPFEELEQFYPEIIEMMIREFDSHRFILKLAEKHQVLYIRALDRSIDAHETPFRLAHRQLAQRLHHFPELVKKIGERNSPDIFGNSNSASLWEKVT